MSTIVRNSKLLSEIRLSSVRNNASESIKQEGRSSFQRDFDRIIFSSAFRRLQNKTQVFPLPGSIFVHNRLTHSLEVASVGRSLGKIVASKIFPDNLAVAYQWGEVVAAACLAHDIGNPPFGHSGETAIAAFYKEKLEDDKELTEHQKNDLMNFEGNANTLRILTHEFPTKTTSGYDLTIPVLASLIKYPWNSMYDCSSTHKLDEKKKFGFFSSETQTISDIFKHLYDENPNDNNKNIDSSPIAHSRFPFTYLVEAADDICYQIIDIEDAHRLGILSYKDVEGLFLLFFKDDNSSHQKYKIEERLNKIADNNDKIAYLRANVINKLVEDASTVFVKRFKLQDPDPKESVPKEKYFKLENSGSFTPLLDEVSPVRKVALEEIKKISKEKIYNHASVVEIEIAGYKILGGLLGEFASCILSNEKSRYNKKILELIPKQYQPNEKGNVTQYEKLMYITDFVSGMTDLFALELFQKIRGISPLHL